MSLLAMMDNDRWHPGIGDPTFIGWFTVAAYCAAVVLCWKVAMKERLHVSKNGFGPFLAWFLATLLLVLLGINKQLDLQTWLTEFGKDWAKEEGWYEHRRRYQFAFILFLCLTGGASCYGLSLLCRNAWPRLKWLVCGIVFIVVFVLVRAASFHYVDKMLGWDLAGWRTNWTLELGGIFVVIYAAFSNLRSSPSGVRARSAPKPTPRENLRKA